MWIDQDLCTGDGLCTDHAPEVFTLLEDGIAYVKQHGRVLNDPGGSGSLALVPAGLLQATVHAAEDCPGECIHVVDGSGVAVAGPDFLGMPAVPGRLSG